MNTPPDLLFLSLAWAVVSSYGAALAWVHSPRIIRAIAARLAKQTQPLHIMKTIDSESPPTQNQVKNYRRPLRIRNHERIHKVALHRMKCGDATDAGDAFMLACGLSGVSDKRRVIPRLP